MGADPHLLDTKVGVINGQIEKEVKDFKSKSPPGEVMGRAENAILKQPVQGSVETTMPKD
jgi:hypothetical protein